MKNTNLKSKWSKLMIAAVAITVPTTASAFLVVACSNPTKDTQKAKEEIKQFSKEIKVTPKLSGISNNAIAQMVNDLSFDINDNDLFEFDLPEEASNYTIEVSAVVYASNVRLIISIKHNTMQNVYINMDVDFEVFNDVDSPEDEAIVALYGYMNKIKPTNKQPGVLRIDQVIERINNPASVGGIDLSQVNDAIDLGLGGIDELNKLNQDFSIKASAARNPAVNTSLDLTITLTSILHPNVTKTATHAVTNFVFFSEQDAEKESIEAFVAALTVEAKDKNLTLRDALTIVNTADFDVYSNNVLTLSDTSDKYIINATASEESLTQLKVNLVFISKKYSDIRIEKSYVIGDFVDGRISETATIEALLTADLITKRTDAVATNQTAQEAFDIIAKTDFNAFTSTNIVFSFKDDAIKDKLSKYTVTTTATMNPDVTQLGVQLQVTSIIYPDITITKDYVLIGFIDPVLAETNNVKTVLNKISITKSTNQFGADEAMSIINGTNFDVFNNNVYDSNWKPTIDELSKFDITVRAAKLPASDVDLRLTFTVTSKKIDTISQSKTIDLKDFEISDPDLTAQLALLDEFMNGLSVDKKPEDKYLIDAIDAVNAPDFDAFNNEYFIINKTIDTTKFTIHNLATKVDDASFSYQLTITSIKFPTVSQAKTFTLGGFLDKQGVTEAIDKLNDLIANLTVTRITDTLPIDDSLAEINKPDFDATNNSVFTLDQASLDAVNDFSFKAAATKANSTTLSVKITITSKKFTEIPSRDVTHQISGFIDPLANERAKLEALMLTVNITKKSGNDTLTNDNLLAELNKAGFDYFTNSIVLVTPVDKIKEFNYTFTTEVVDKLNFTIKITLTSKTFASITDTKDFNIGPNGATWWDESDLITKLSTEATLTKIPNNMTAVEAKAEIEKSGFNIYSNTIFTLGPAASVSSLQTINVTISKVEVINNDIEITMDYSSKQFADIAKITKVYTLQNYVSPQELEQSKLIALRDSIAITKLGGVDLTAQAAVDLINAPGFNIHNNTIFKLDPVSSKFNGFKTSISATVANQTDIIIELVITSNTYSNITDTSSFNLYSFNLPPASEGVIGTGIEKVWNDSKAGTVYIGTAEKYNLGGKEFYGDEYTLNPFQDYGAEELTVLQAAETWPQIKQLIASSRPVNGTPNVLQYLPAEGTPITFTDEVKKHQSIPSNVKRFISILDENLYNEIFYYRNEVYTYRDFVTAIAKYPRILAEVNLEASFIKNNNDLYHKGSLSPEKALAYTAKLEIATMFSHFMQETGAGYGTMTAQQRAQQIPWNLNYNPNFVPPTNNFTNNDILGSVGTNKLANAVAMAADPTKKVGGTENQALYWVTEALFMNTATEPNKENGELARKEYTKNSLASVGEATATASFPVPGAIGSGTANVSYIGRGAKQLSWNYNYGPASRVFFGIDDAETLLNDPSRVAKEGWLAMGSAIMFYMTPVGNKPSMHDVVTGAWEPGQAEQTTDNLKSGFGITINIINGGLEIKPAGKVENNQTVMALNRQYYFNVNVKRFGIEDYATNSTYFDNAGYKQTSFAEVASIKVVQSNWVYQWNSPTAIAIVSWDTSGAFKANFPGDYYRSIKSFENSTFHTDNGLSWTLDEIPQFRSNDWKAGKNPTYTKVGPDYDWKSK